MANLKSSEQLAVHVKNHKGLPADRKKEIAEHLAALPATHHVAVRQVLEDHAEDADSKFIRGCFADAGETTPDLPTAA